MTKTAEVCIFFTLFQGVLAIFTGLVTPDFCFWLRGPSSLSAFLPVCARMNAALPSTAF
jgi:hypothetical protein